MTEKKANILILEDNINTIGLLNNIVPNESFNLQFVETQEGLFAELNKNTDIIITDLKVPKHPGGVSQLVTQEFFQRIHNAVSGINIIILTGSSYEYTDKVEVEDFLEKRPYFCLNKDTASPELILLIIDFYLKSNERNNDSTKNQQKGKVLECLMAWIFESIDGFYIEMNMQTRLGEMDIMISNEVRHSPFWHRKGDNIPVECKNKKLGEKEGIGSKNEFEAKVNGLNDCKLGFFVSTRGFTRCFLDSLVTSADKYVVPIDDFRIKELAQSAERITLLADYVREISQRKKSINKLMGRNT